MDKIDVISNPRKSNGDLGHFYCVNCGSRSGAYIQLKEKEIIVTETHGPQEIYREKGLICKGCLLEWVSMIDKDILKQCGLKSKCKDVIG
jgi:hypothetical protein